MPAARTTITEEASERVCRALESGQSAREVAAEHGFSERSSVFRVYFRHRGVAFSRTPFSRKKPRREGPPPVRIFGKLPPSDLLAAELDSPVERLAAAIAVCAVLDARHGDRDALDFVRAPCFEAMTTALGWDVSVWRHYGRPVKSGPIGPVGVFGE